VRALRDVRARRAQATTTIERGDLYASGDERFEVCTGT
jgi:hypothetical protein